jgi:hypothetical protein
VIDASGNVTGYGTPKAPDGSAGENPAGITLEMGSLFVSEANAPVGATGTVQLCKVKYTGSTNSTLALALNATRGNAVNEDTNPATLTLTGTTIAFAVAECVKNTAPFYADWVAWGKPVCWAYQRNCRGDADGQQVIATKTVPAHWVGTPDLTILSNAWKKTDAQLVGVVGGICADFDHTAVLATKTVPAHRVGTPDLTALSTYWKSSTTPVCDQTNYNFWTN